MMRPGEGVFIQIMSHGRKAQVFYVVVQDGGNRESRKQKKITTTLLATGHAA